MAIDNIIAAGIQPATPIMSPMQTMGGLMQLRGQMADQSLREAQMVEVRQRQQNEKLRGDQINLDQTDQKYIQALSPEAYAQIYSGNLSGLYGKVQQSTIENVLKSVDEHVNKLATNDGLQLKNQGDALGQLSSIVVNLGLPNKDGTAPDAGTINSQYQSVKGQLPNLLKLAGINSPPPDTIDSPEQLRQFEVQLRSAKAATDYAVQRKLDTANADKAIAEARLAVKKEVGTNAQGLTSKDLFEIAQHDATIANTKAQLPKIQADAAIAQLEAKFRQEHNGLSANELKTAQLRQKEFDLKSGGVSLTSQQQSIADKLASGDLNPSQLARFQDKEAILAGAIAKGFNQSTYDTKQAFDNPRNKQSQNLGTISRIVGHIQRYEENSAKMGTDPIYGLGQNLTGLQKALTEDAQAMAAELEKLFSGGVGTQAQIKEWESSLRSSFAGVREKAINEISKLAGSQFESMNQTYKTGLGKDLPLEKYVNADGRKWLQKNGINVSGETEFAAPAAEPAAGPTKIANDDDFNKLKSGQEFIGPDGVKRRKP
jgi:hypothetical protein